jgi:hypothetical protein
VKRVWTRRGDVRMALVGAVKIGEDTVENPRLFSTFFIVVAIRLKSIHCPTYVREYSSRPPRTRQEEILARPSRDNRDAPVSGLDLANDDGTPHTTGMQRIYKRAGLRRRQCDK